MSKRILILFIVSLSTLLLAGSPQSKEQNMTTVKSPTHAPAKAKITVQSSETKPYDPNRGPGISGDKYNRNFLWRYRRRINGSGFTDPTRRSIGQPRQPATIPRKTGRTPWHLRASRSGNRRERQDQGDMVCRSRIGDRWSFRVARRGRL